jgi:hypothetical protein
LPDLTRNLWITDNEDRRYIGGPFRYLLVVKRGFLKGIIKTNSRKNVRGKRGRIIELENIFFTNITRYYNAYGEKSFNLLITRLFGGEFDILDIKHTNKKDVT